MYESCQPELNRSKFNHNSIENIDRGYSIPNTSLLTCMPTKQLRKAKNALPGPVIRTPEYACNAVKSMPVAGPPSIKLDMDLAWALPKCLSYS